MIAISIAFFFFICYADHSTFLRKQITACILMQHYLSTQISHGDWLSGVLPLISCSFFSSFHSQPGCVQHEILSLSFIACGFEASFFFKGDLWPDFVPSKACVMRPIDIFLCCSP